MRRHDIDWRKTLPEWSNYDLDAMIRDIEEEKARRNTPKSRPFRSY